jgi:hypothetical protein
MEWRKLQLHFVRVEVLTAATMSMAVFWVIKACELVSSSNLWEKHIVSIFRAEVTLNYFTHRPTKG